MHGRIAATTACNVCRNGLLVFATRVDDGRVFVECDECMTGYWDPVTPGSSFRTESTAWETRDATLDEVVRAGWGDLVQ